MCGVLDSDKDEIPAPDGVEDFQMAFNSYAESGPAERDASARRFAGMGAQRLLDLMAEVPFDAAAVFAGCLVPQPDTYWLPFGRLSAVDRPAKAYALKAKGLVPFAVVPPRHPAAGLIEGLMAIPDGVGFCRRIHEYLSWGARQEEMRPHLAGASPDAPVRIVRDVVPDDEGSDDLPDDGFDGSDEGDDDV